MKHLRKFNENIDSKDPIDVESDMIEFKSKFIDDPKAKEWWYRRLSGVKPTERDEKYQEIINSIQSKVDNFISENPTMTDKYFIYYVWNTDNDPKNEIYIKAVSHPHAYIKASILLDNPEIAYHRIIKRKDTTWKCIELTNKQLNARADEIRKVIEFSNIRLDKMNNIQ